MASRLAVRYIPLRFSSNATRNLIVEGKAIDHSLPSINQITVKPSTTINHHYYNQSRPDQFSPQEFNHLQNRVTRVEERAHGFEKSIIKGVEQSERIDKRFEEVVERVQEVEGEVGLVREIANNLTYLERKVDDFDRESFYSTDIRINEFEDRIREIKECLRERVRKVEERLEGFERSKRIDDDIFSYHEVRGIKEEMQGLYYLNETNGESIREVEDRMKEVEEKVKEVDERLVNEAKEMAKDFAHLERQVTDVAILNFKNVEERIVNQFEERMTVVEKLEPIKEAIDETIKKVEERMKKVEETTQVVEERMLQAEAKVKEVNEKLVNEVEEIGEDLTRLERQITDVENEVDSVKDRLIMNQLEERMEKIEDTTQGIEISMAIGVEQSELTKKTFKEVDERVKKLEDNVMHVRDLAYLERNVTERTAKLIKKALEDPIKKVEERMKNVEERTRGIEKSMVKGVEQSECMPLVERVKQFEKQVIDGIDGRVGKLEARMNEAEKSTTEGVEGAKEFKKEVCKTSTYLDGKDSDIEPMISRVVQKSISKVEDRIRKVEVISGTIQKSISKVEDTIRKVEERLKKIEQPGRIDKIIKEVLDENIKKLIEERMKKVEEGANGVLKTVKK